MSIKDNLNEAAGKAKEAVGKAFDNDKLEAEGQAQQTEAKVKGAADDVASGIGDAADRIKR